MQEDKFEYKSLTAAQRSHLAALHAERQRLEAEIQRFVGYLAIEHNAPAGEGWSEIDAERGFVRKVATADNK